MMTGVRVELGEEEKAPTLGNLGSTIALLNDDVAALKSFSVHDHFHKKKR